MRKIRELSHYKKKKKYDRSNVNASFSDKELSDLMTISDNLNLSKSEIIRRGVLLMIEKHRK